MKKVKISNIPFYILGTEFLYISVILASGSKIFNFIFKHSGNYYAWDNPIIPLKQTVYGASFIPYNCGGFEIIFKQIRIKTITKINRVIITFSH